MALAGVLFGLWIGQRRWRTEQDQKQQAKFLENRMDAYIELWDVVEQLNTQLREIGFFPYEPKDFLASLSGVNNFMLRKGLFIEQDDRYLVLDYLSSTFEFLQEVAGDHQAAHLLQSSFVVGAEPALLKELIAIDRRNRDQREKLKARIREVLEVPAPSQPLRDSDGPPAALLARIERLHLKSANREAFQRESGLHGVVWPKSRRQHVSPDNEPRKPP